MQKFKFFTLAILAMLSVNLAWGADSGLQPADGKFIIDFYDSSKLTSTSGTGLANNNYSNFVKVATGLTKSNVVTSVSVTGTVQYGKNGGLTAGSSTAAGADSHYVTFNIGDDYAVNKVTVYATEYETGKWQLNGTNASSGSLGAKGATFSNVTSPLVWDDLDGVTTLTFKKMGTSGGNQKRLTIYTIVCEYTAATPTITKTANLTNFTYEVGSGPSAVQSFTVGGSNLTANITVTAPTNFEVSKSSGSGYASSVTLTQSSGTVSNTTIYVRMKSGLSQGTGKGGNITLSSTGATTQTIAVVGTVTAPAVKYTVTFNAGSGTCGTASLTEASAGAGVNLPVASPSSACGTDGWTFAGWAAASQAETTTAPTLYAANSNYKPSSNCTLYAVYSKTESGGGGGSGVDQIVKNDWGTQGTQTSGSAMSVTTGHGIVVSSTKGYYGGDNTYAQFYANDVITITPASGMTITQIVFTANGTSNNGWQGTNPPGVVSSNIGSISGNSSNVATTWTGSATTAIEVSHDKQMRLVTIDITYSGSSGTTTYNSNPSCATCTNLITITKGTPSNGSFTLTGAGTDICADEPVTVNLSNIIADPHYHATAVTTSATTGGGTPSAITSDGSASVTGITASTTINVTFAEDTKVVVTLLNNNNPVNAGGFDAQGKKEYYTGETLGALPTLTSTDACDATSTTFMGWTFDAGFQKRAAAPSFVTPTTPVTGNMTLRAVWARGE